MLVCYQTDYNVESCRVPNGCTQYAEKDCNDLESKQPESLHPGLGSIEEERFQPVDGYRMPSLAFFYSDFVVWVRWLRKSRYLVSFFNVGCRYDYLPSTNGAIEFTQRNQLHPGNLIRVLRTNYHELASGRSRSTHRVRRGGSRSGHHQQRPKIRHSQSYLRLKKPASEPIKRPVLMEEGLPVKSIEKETEIGVNLGPLRAEKRKKVTYEEP